MGGKAKYFSVLIAIAILQIGCFIWELLWLNNNPSVVGFILTFFIAFMMTNSVLGLFSENRKWNAHEKYMSQLDAEFSARYPNLKI